VDATSFLVSNCIKGTVTEARGKEQCNKGTRKTLVMLDDKRHQDTILPIQNLILEILATFCLQPVWTEVV